MTSNLPTSAEALKPSANPNCFGNYKGMLELIGIYSNDVTVLNANFRKWALKYHPDKGGEKDFFSLVTECVKGASSYLSSLQAANSVPVGFEVVPFQGLAEHMCVRYQDDLGSPVHGVILQMHPPWSPDKTHIVICKTDANWVPEPNTKKMYVCKESIRGLLLKKTDGPVKPTTTTTTTPTPTPTTTTTTTTTPQPTPTMAFAHSFENVQWRDLRAGDKIRVTYVHVKNPTNQITAYGIFRAAPTYSDVVEFVKTDETFTQLSKSFTSLPLTGSMCRFQRLVVHKMHPQAFPTPSPSFPSPSPSLSPSPSHPAWASGSCAAMPAANASTKKRKVA